MSGSCCVGMPLTLLFDAKTCFKHRAYVRQLAQAGEPPANLKHQAVLIRCCDARRAMLAEAARCDFGRLVHEPTRRIALVGASSKAHCRRKFAVAAGFRNFSRSGELACQRDSLGGSCLALLQNVQSPSFPGASPLPISSTGAPAASKPFCSGSGGAFKPEMHGRQLNLRRGRRSGPVG